MIDLRQRFEEEHQHAGELEKLGAAALELGDLPPGSRAIVSICAAGGLGHIALPEAV